MSREIKYQAYLKTEYHVDDGCGCIIWIQEGMYVVTELHFEGGELSSINIDTEEFGEVRYLDLDYLGSRPFEIREFTGLHDTNNVPIYEGDIIP
ncbi:MAG: hypothetical protein K8E24_003005 [Methanobacterium paludis]|nr:hypothetical protein [Methanobacterium paludis]